MPYTDPQFYMDRCEIDTVTNSRAQACTNAATHAIDLRSRKYGLCGVHQEQGERLVSISKM